MKIQDSVALVTGANRGLGLPSPRRCSPAAPARSMRRRAIRPRSSPGVQAIRLDVTKPARSTPRRATWATYLLVNNAGMLRGSGFLATTAWWRCAPSSRPISSARCSSAAPSHRSSRERRRRDRQRAVGAVLGEHTDVFDLLRVEVGGVVAEQRLAPRAARAGHAGPGPACRLHGHRHGAPCDGAEVEARGRVGQTLAAWRPARRRCWPTRSAVASSGLAAEPGVYLAPPAVPAAA